MLDHIGMQFELNCVSVMCVSLNVIILTMLVLPGLGKERALNGDVDVADLIRRVQQIHSFGTNSHSGFGARFYL